MCKGQVVNGTACISVGQFTIRTLLQVSHNFIGRGIGLWQHTQILVTCAAAGMGK